MTKKAKKNSTRNSDHKIIRDELTLNDNTPKVLPCLR